LGDASDVTGNPIDAAISAISFADKRRPFAASRSASRGFAA